LKTVVRSLVLWCVAAAGIVRAQAPPVDIEFFYVWSTSPGAAGPGHRLDYSGSGLGGGFNFRLDNFSANVASWHSGAFLRLVDEGQGGFGAVDVVPLSVTVQWHPLGRKWFDPYVGVGGAVLFPSTSIFYAPGGEVLDVIVDTGVTLAAQAGFRIRVAGAIGLLLDVKYMPASLDAKLLVAEPPGTADVELDADLVSVAAGLSLRF